MYTCVRALDDTSVESYRIPLAIVPCQLRISVNKLCLCPGLLFEYPLHVLHLLVHLFPVAAGYERTARKGSKRACIGCPIPIKRPKSFTSIVDTPLITCHHYSEYSGPSIHPTHWHNISNGSMPAVCLSSSMPEAMLPKLQVGMLDSMSLNLRGNGLLRFTNYGLGWMSRGGKLTAATTSSQVDT